MNLKSGKNPYLIISIVGSVFFMSWLGGVHLFDWDEINFAEMSREMVLSGNYTGVTIDFQPFYQKPPLFFWLQVLAMHIFGINEFAARFPNAVFGVATLLLLFHLGKKHFDSTTGWLWAGTYFGSVLPFLYFKSGIIDPVFNLFIFLGIYFIIRFHWQKTGIFPEGGNKKKNYKHILLAGLFIGLAILTKGPVAYLIVVLVLGVYWLFQRFRMYINIPEFLLFSLSAAVVTLAWFGLETLVNGPDFVIEFTRYQYRLLSTPDAGHKGFPLYHAVVLLVGCFPASIFMIKSFSRKDGGETAGLERDFSFWMKILFWTVLILFSIVQSKIVHYSSLAYFPLTFLAASVIRKIISGQVSFTSGMQAGLIGLGSLYILVIVVLAACGFMGLESIQGTIKDPFAAANLLAEVRWSGWEWLPAFWMAVLIGLFMFFLRKKSFKTAFQWLFVSMGIFTLLTLVFFVRRIEGYSQRAAIEYFQSLAEEDAYILPVGYKTYGHLFYGKTLPGKNNKSREQEWLLQSPDLDKPVYIITKIHKAESLRLMDGLEEIGQKNGFVFFRRMPKR